MSGDRGGWLADPVLLFKGMVCMGLRLELKFYKMINGVKMERRGWMYGCKGCIVMCCRVLCNKVSNT